VSARSCADGLQFEPSTVDSYELREEQYQVLEMEEVLCSISINEHVYVVSVRLFDHSAM